MSKEMHSPWVINICIIDIHAYKQAPIIVNCVLFTALITILWRCDYYIVIVFFVALADLQSSVKMEPVLYLGTVEIVLVAGYIDSTRQISAQANFLLK